MQGHDDGTQCDLGAWAGTLSSAICPVGIRAFVRRSCPTRVGRKLGVEPCPPGSAGSDALSTGVRRDTGAKPQRLVQATAQARMDCREPVCDFHPDILAACHWREACGRSSIACGEGRASVPATKLGFRSHAGAVQLILGNRRTVFCTIQVVVVSTSQTRETGPCAGLTHQEACLAYHAQRPIRAARPPRGRKKCAHDCNHVGTCFALTGFCQCPAGASRGLGVQCISKPWVRWADNL